MPEDSTIPALKEGDLAHHPRSQRVVRVRAFDQSCKMWWCDPVNGDKPYREHDIHLFPNTEALTWEPVADTEESDFDDIVEDIVGANVEL